MASGITEACTLTPAVILDTLAALRRLQAKAEARGDGPDMSRPTATAADFRGLGNA